VTLVTEGNSEKGVSDIRAILARTGGNCVINVDPNDSPDARPIVEACKEAGAYVVTQWNKPADLHPWDYDPNYVAHISFSGVPYGQAMAEALFKAMGGKGGIVALGGIQSNVPAIERKAGLDAALAANPDIKLLDFQVANWSDTEALEKTNAWLTQFGDEIGGIWAANDGMGLAAVEALRADGRAGKVPVTGIDGIQLAVEAILKGEMAGTVAWDPYWQGGMGLSIGYHAKTGKFDPTTEPKDHREFYGTGVIITSDNAQSYYDTNIKAEPTLDWNDIWGRVSGQIQYN
jgi:ribose transport system substrate-binding protein